MKICFETFGCRLNRAEALQMEADYLAAGWTRTESHADADLLVVRGCSVTSRAQRECERLIDHLRRKYPFKPIKICGCLKGIQSLSQAKVPEVPAVSATPTRTARAYLKAQDGCSGQCTFCIVPKFRGKATSVPFAEVLDRARKFLDAGYREIVLTGCNLAQYLSAGKRLPDLVSHLSEAIGSDARLRLGSVEPGSAALAFVRLMAERENICRFLHLPIQSASNGILIAMKRPYLLNDVEEILRTARDLMPGIGLGCDIMTGFPGESKYDHAATLGLLRRHSFSNVHVFPYSERPGTPAANQPNQVPMEIRFARAREISTLARHAVRDVLNKNIGKTVRMIIESEEKGTGWTGEYLPCQINGYKTAPGCRRKDLVSLRVTGVIKGRLVGTLTSAAKA